MFEYFEKEEELLTKDMNINISSDIIESTFGICPKTGLQSEPTHLKKWVKIGTQNWAP